MIQELAKTDDWTQERKDLLRKTVAMGCTEMEFELFLHVVRKTGLDPFAKQIHAVKRNRKKKDGSGWEEYLVIQVGIDGFRIVADRKRDDKGARLHKGMTAPQWYDKATGQWTEVWVDEKNPPHACKIGVYRSDSDQPRWAPPVYYDALVQRYKGQNGQQGEPQEQWRNMKGASQLAKCAESAALRQNYPQELGGVYLNEEMEQAESVEAQTKREKTEKSEEFVDTIPPELATRLAQCGFDTVAKVKNLAEEGGNTLEGLTIHVEACEMLARLDDTVKNQIRGVGYKNQAEARRLLVKCKNDLKVLMAYLDGGHMPTEVPALPETKVEVIPAPAKAPEPAPVKSEVTAKVRVPKGTH